MPKLSIIVPIYNVEKDLPKCIDSVLAQTFEEFELILINDGSPDKCAEIMEQYAKIDKRIITVHQENMGVSAARNAGLRIATGQYVGFIDPDGWIRPSMYQTMITVAEEFSLDIVCCNWCENEIEHECSIKQFTIFDSETFYIHMFDIPKTYSDCVWNKLYRKDFIGTREFTKGIKQAEDYLFLCDIYNPNGKMGYIPECLYLGYDRPGSASNSGTWKRMQALEVRKNVVEKYKKISKRIYQAAVVECLDLAMRFKSNMINEKETEEHIRYVEVFISDFIKKNAKAIIFSTAIYWKTKLVYLVKALKKW